MKPKIALVLGAGSSVSMGYPVGEALREEIINNTIPVYGSILQSLGYSSHSQEHFVKEFRRSQMETIDSFLARRPEFSEVGKIAIAAILLHKEDETKLHTFVHEDRWYRYFFNKIAIENWEKLNLSYISIISFNYDRSFEHYIVNALSASYGKQLDEAYDKLNELNIIHIYGILGICDPNSSEYFPYDSQKLNSTNISIGASKLKVIPEGRNDDPGLIKARNILMTADRIGFLGFGFDPANLERLDSSTTCKRVVIRQEVQVARKVVGTSYGLTNAEVTKAALATTGNSDSVIEDIIRNFHNTNCLQMLRNTLILD